MKGLHIHGVSHSFGRSRVLDNVSLTIPAGDLVCLLGPSGSGKSTLLRLAAGLEVLQEGRIVIDDETVADPAHHAPPERRRVGLMFQDYALFPHMTILDNVGFGLLGSTRRAARERAMAMLEQVSMTAFAQAYPHTLSGGQQQRVALARALAPEPKLLLLDEPFSGLDTSMREKIRHDMLGVLKQSGVATMMVTHDPEEAMYMADRIKILGGGEVQQAGRPHDIYYKPEDEFVARLFGLINVIEGVVEGSTVSTPFGAVEARGHENGAPVRVLIRPEGIVLESSGAGAEGCPIEVVSTHLLGHGSIVRIQVSDGADGGEEFQVRVHKEFTPELDGTILARIDPAHAFVFPAAAATESGARHGFRPTVLEGGARPGAAGEAGKGDRGTTVAAE